MAEASCSPGQRGGKLCHQLYRTLKGGQGAEKFSQLTGINEVEGLSTPCVEIWHVAIQDGNVSISRTAASVGRWREELVRELRGRFRI